MKGLKGQNPSPRITRPKLAGSSLSKRPLSFQSLATPRSLSALDSFDQSSEKLSVRLYEHVSEQASEGPLVSVDLEQESEMSGTDAFAVSIDL